MSIEERLEALAQSLEILTGMQHANERQFDDIRRNFLVVLDSIKRLENIAVTHE